MMMLNDSSDDDCDFYVSEKHYSEGLSRALANGNDPDRDFYNFSVDTEAEVSTLTDVPENSNSDVSDAYIESEEEEVIAGEPLTALMEYHRKSLLLNELCSYIHDYNQYISVFGGELLAMRLSLKEETLSDNANLRKQLSRCRKQAEFCRKVGDLLCKFLDINTYDENYKQLEAEIKVFENLPWTSFITDDVFMNPTTGLAWKFIGVFQKFDNVTKTFLNQFLKYVDLIKLYKESGDLENICLHKKETQMASLTRSSLLLSHVTNRLTNEMNNYQAALGFSIIKTFLNFYQYLCSFFKKLFPFVYIF
ncbi:unnamed protein product [Auanema sp. JU1783]|nr:unnamed protein product [Auanema sp. JU1783]